MFCKNCIGTGIVSGIGEYRGVCIVCNGFGREIIIKLEGKKSDVNLTSNAKRELKMNKIINQTI
jgi:hypothetical protein